MRHAVAAIALAALTGCMTGSGADAPLPASLAVRPLPAGWQLQTLQPHGTLQTTRPVTVLSRPAVQEPPRWRLIVLPGSGCTGFVPIAQRYFAAVRHADIWVLHKPGTNVLAGATPAACPSGFEAQDRLARWQDDARAALAALPWDGPARPTWIAGISEGGELLAALAPTVPWPTGLLLLSASGLDPIEAGALQAQRLGAAGAWHALERKAQGPQPDAAWAQGRPLGYWRDLFRWRVADELIGGPWPILQVWGGADAAVPAEAYERFAARAAQRPAPFCSWRMPGADHGLQGADGSDGVQRVWARLDAAPQADAVCAAIERAHPRP
jgi:dienelactone hydrolase